MKERNLGVDFLKAIAILMIANFHAGRMYSRFAFLATGGDVGNAIFFFVSGLTLLPSVKKLRNHGRQVARGMLGVFQGSYHLCWLGLSLHM